jgi:hypothetical protein
MKGDAMWGARIENSDGWLLAEGSRVQDYMSSLCRKSSSCEVGFSAEDIFAKAKRKIQKKALECPLLGS